MIGRSVIQRGAAMTGQIFHLMLAGCLVLGACAANQPRSESSAGAREALFEFRQVDPKGKEHFFIFKLTDPTRIEEARAIIAGAAPLKVHVHGTIIKHQATYNPQWSFHLAPQTVGFFEFQIEVCDANVTYVQEHLDEVGGSFLPRSFWCPWSSRLVRELN